ncbi:MAG: ComEC/Rec2 family competence protein, partial [Kiloniellales bacterium]
MRRWLSAELAAERDRWALWLPVALGCGIAGYFALHAEPPGWLGALAVVGSLGVLALLFRQGSDGRWPGALLVAFALAGASTGFAAAQLRGALVSAPVLTRELRGVEITGLVAEIDPMAGAYRLVLEALEIGRLDEHETPARVRVRVWARGGVPHVGAGDLITLRAALVPPPGPAIPGGFDFQRRAWFQRIGAVGFAFGRPTVVRPAGQMELGWRRASARRIAGVRRVIFERVTASLEGATGGVAAALMTGERGAIPPETLTAMRDSGLAHLLAISGLHIGLVAGIVFFAIRGGLALWPAVVLRYPVKKWAAAIALIVAFAYLLLAGAPVPTQRAFMMTGLVLLAVMLDRTGISMRLVAWAAVVILVLRPETLLGASFQMSFAAALALVAVYEALGDRLRIRYREAGLAERAGLYLGGVALTTLIAGLATMPVALFHFSRVAVFGLAANLVAVPLTALWVMPWAVAAFALMPFGFEGLALIPMGWGLDGVIATAHVVASWPGSVELAPAMPLAGYVAIVAGGLWLMLLRRRWRCFGLLPVLAG